MNKRPEIWQHYRLMRRLLLRALPLLASTPAGERLANLIQEALKEMATPPVSLARLEPALAQLKNALKPQAG